jgi:translation initiation factor IF-2
MIVAVNKIDKPDAKPERVVNELLQHEIVAESLGGETQIVNVSAIKRTGLDDLVETILLQAEILDLKANPDRSAEAVVVEAKLDRGRGPVATVLVQRGTLKRGDIVVAGAAWGRVRALVNERGQQISAAGPSEPAEIMGLEGVPDPGDQLVVVENENRAREVVEYRQRVKREKAGVGGGGPRASLEQMMARFKDNTAKELPVVIKADVQGSAEAISGALEKLGTEEVRARVLQSTVGAINEADITLAKASGAPVIGFNVRASKEARDLAEREGVEIRYYAIIYDVIDDIKGVMSGMLAPIQRETFLGTSRVLEVFQISKIGRVAGCRVEEGKMQRGARIRLLRDNVVIHEGGKLNTLKRFKDDVNEVQTGQECGMSFENYQDIKQGDVVECYLLETVQRSL